MTHAGKLIEKQLEFNIFIVCLFINQSKLLVFLVITNFDLNKTVWG